MTDLEQWKEWLNKWGVKYEISYYECIDPKHVYIEVYGPYCHASIQFNKHDESFVKMSAYE